MARFAQVFAPRDRIYFELFEEAGQNMLRARRSARHDARPTTPRTSTSRTRSSIASTRAIGSRTTSSIASTTRSSPRSTARTSSRSRRRSTTSSTTPRRSPTTSACTRSRRRWTRRSDSRAVLKRGVGADRRGDPPAARLPGHLALHGRDQPARERGRPDHPRGGRVAVRRRHRPDGRDPLEGPVRAPRGRDRRDRAGGEHHRRDRDQELLAHCGVPRRDDALEFLPMMRNRVRGSLSVAVLGVALASRPRSPLPRRRRSRPP